MLRTTASTRSPRSARATAAPNSRTSSPRRNHQSVTAVAMMDSHRNARLRRFFALARLSLIQRYRSNDPASRRLRQALRRDAGGPHHPFDFVESEEFYDADT